MKRPPGSHSIQTYGNLLLGPANNKTIYVQLKKLAQKKAQLEKKVNRYQYLIDQGDSELRLLDTAMNVLLGKVRSTPQE